MMASIGRDTTLQAAKATVRAGNFNNSSAM
jgi:hypothetical protein